MGKCVHLGGVYAREECTLGMSWLVAGYFWQLAGHFAKESRLPHMENLL